MLDWDEVMKYAENLRLGDYDDLHSYYYWSSGTVVGDENFGMGCLSNVFKIYRYLMNYFSLLDYNKY